MHLGRKPIYLDDPRNDDVLVYVDGRFFPRDQATVSVYDSGLTFGDGIWETLRLVYGRVAALDAHLDRLVAGAAMLGFDPAPTREELSRAVDATLQSNEMIDDGVIRIMMSRGRRRTPEQDPRTLVSPPTVIIMPEYKVFRPLGGPGIALATTTIRASAQEATGPQVKCLCRLDNVRAQMQAAALGADAALMLDHSGHVASCNAANFFAVIDGELWTSTGAHCFRGITRRTVIDLWRKSGGIVHERDFPPSDLTRCTEAFVTDTIGGITPVRALDGCLLEIRGDVTVELMRLYDTMLRTA